MSQHLSRRRLHGSIRRSNLHGMVHRVVPPHSLDIRRNLTIFQLLHAHQVQCVGPVQASRGEIKTHLEHSHRNARALVVPEDGHTALPRNHTRPYRVGRPFCRLGGRLGGRRAGDRGGFCDACRMEVPRAAHGAQWRPLKSPQPELEHNYWS